MKFVFLYFILFISKTYSIRFKENENFILKFTENYYNKLGRDQIDKFKSMMFRELDKKTILDKHTYETLNQTDNKAIDFINGLSPNNMRKQYSDEIREYSGEYISVNRVVKLHISHSPECSVFINDTILYNIVSPVNFVEHMILHNNAEYIDPRGVYSDDLSINFFAFNKKLNIFSVYFEQPKNKNFTIEYDYDAINLIKTNIEQIDSGDNNITHVSSNNFIWKILNQNFIKLKENLTIEVYFDLGKEFEHEDVEFSLNFTKSLHEENKRTMVKYVWNGIISPQEVLVLQTKFPLYFESCGNLNVNWIMIFIGSVFIIFLIGMLYMILSTVFLDDI